LGGDEEIVTMLHVTVGKKRKGGEELKWEDLDAESLAALASTEALFGGARTFVLSGVLYGERGEEFLKSAKELVSSPHVFVFEEEKLLKKETEALTKAGAKIEILKAVKKEYGFDPFGLTAALGNRDRKKLWFGVVQAMEGGEKPEAITGLLHWKVRDMLGNKRGATKYTKEELSALSREVVTLYHDSHRGAGSLEILLERFALRL
jgi:DNA polymerase III delta subunit